MVMVTRSSFAARLTCTSGTAATCQIHGIWAPRTLCGASHEHESHRGASQDLTCSKYKSFCSIHRFLVA
ncbi:hypothetical protein HBI56_218690 [Parastagonospora nodorum]|uniref:Uncharacterized protein n=1 Tax=Phaeosphaeria nodorum (strain SN15 / ATCC MYA-4574 / FGSC 10173) TaxID=321614 RepID=A0A7U2FAY5_PHANO|nr:hypothetical protein HBH56_225370 [Parastagonospora nodorum]QRD01872.1 hypothetical protein JI435_417270 [Parastagonospora nodorum SN15]KAH3935333.1 hypothetical protein HBH54_033360 [Parastagonospora nodorum]KAH3940059.1 hypothetical protein HBH53_223400 [Parastagonospora nodorum]KAH3957613.1 hypothetical protein HBH51_223300 [Parastagonospora nodorum]